MSGKKKAGATVHVDHARPALNQATRTDAEKVAATRSVSTSMQAGPNWAAAPEVQAAVAKWNQVADAIAAKADVAGKLRAQLATLMADLRVSRRDWTVATDHVLSTVNVFSRGSVDTVKGFALEVQSRGAAGATPAPENLKLAPTAHAGELHATWRRGSTARYGFVVQHATDTANLATYSAFEPTTRSAYTLTGLPVGATVYVRVAPIGPGSGLGPWCQWVAAVVR